MIPEHTAVQLQLLLWFKLNVGFCHCTVFLSFFFLRRFADVLAGSWSQWVFSWFPGLIIHLFLLTGHALLGDGVFTGISLPDPAAAVEMVLRWSIIIYLY